jgi:hypothetical protein
VNPPRISVSILDDEEHVFPELIRRVLAMLDALVPGRRVKPR